MTEDELGRLREEIGRVTVEMAKLFVRRAEISSDIGRAKKELGMRITDESREDQLCDIVLGAYRRGFGGRNGGSGSGSTVDPALAEAAISRLLNFLLSESATIQSRHHRDGEDNPTHLSVFQAAKRLEAEEGRQVIHMEVGEPDYMPPDAVATALSESYGRGHIRYESPRGVPELLDALAEYGSKRFGASIGPGNIAVTPGGRFAVFAAMSALLNPGDEVITVEPAWPAYRDCAAYAGARVRAVQASLDESWMPSIRDIQDAASTSTKMIILNYPNNPTGAVLRPDIMDGIMEIASDRGIYVLGDEIYSEYVRGAKPWRSVASYGYHNAIAVQSFSKSHAMTGLRIGYAMADGHVIDKIASLLSLCMTSVPAPVQRAALSAVGQDVSDNARTISERLDALESEARKMGMEYAKPEGAMYLFARVGTDGARLAGRLLSEYGVAVAPGSGFGENYRDYIRISAAREDTNRLIEGMNRLKSMLDGVYT
ncbi:MAG: aminotransferase class I/II-fold pyridoxal phosphate-dependent enzyme [Nitrosopumilaceae archaeon]|nr:aminotransferase class I/II-fold pyridoxal phosphate-dependent enzyme [Nitrosopumilaceae archaeon]